MRREPWFWIPALIAPIAISAPVYAVTYLTVEQAQRTLFPEATEFQKVNAVLTADQKREIERVSRSRVRTAALSVWRVAAGDRALGVFFVDQVLGKHELITYGVALDAAGAVRGLEILDYRETHGDEVRDARWRAQFVGKRAGAALSINDDVANIAGATLSCKHVTEGVRRLLATYEVVFK